jgi:8-oxo-dGTP pyrophosphatase MutT (NUDIX family)
MNLRKQIEEYIPFDQQEAKEKETMLKYFDTFTDVLTRDNVFGHLCSSAIVVNKNRDKMLAVYHNTHDSWTWPGGHADGDEDLLKVAIKETLEETGVIAKPVIKEIFLIDILPEKSHFKRGKYVSAHSHLSVGYLLEADEETILLIKPDENQGVKWISFDEMLNITTESYMLPIYERAFKKIKNLCKVRN